MHAARAAGYKALTEQVVAELATPDRKEPRVDVDAWGLVAEPRVMLDATITCPFARRYESKDAAMSGERRKDREYPCRAGLAVTGVAVDVFGRHGPAMLEILTKFADLARQHDLDRGLQPRRWLHSWRVRIATELVRGCARQICAANFAAAPVRRATAPTLAHTATSPQVLHLPGHVQQPASTSGLCMHTTIAGSSTACAATATTTQPPACSRSSANTAPGAVADPCA